MAKFDRHKYYIEKIAEKINLKPEIIDGFIRAGLLRDCNIANNTIGEIDQQVNELKALDKLKHFLLLSESQLALKIGVDVYDLRKMYQSGIFKPDFFYRNDNGESIFAISKKQLLSLQQAKEQLLNELAQVKEQEELESERELSDPEENKEEENISKESSEKKASKEIEEEEPVQDERKKKKTKKKQRKKRASSNNFASSDSWFDDLYSTSKQEENMNDKGEDYSGPVSHSKEYSESIPAAKLKSDDSQIIDQHVSTKNDIEDVSNIRRFFGNQNIENTADSKEQQNPFEFYKGSVETEYVENFFKDDTVNVSGPTIDTNKTIDKIKTSENITTTFSDNKEIQNNSNISENINTLTDNPLSPDSMTESSPKEKASDNIGDIQNYKYFIEKPDNSGCTATYNGQIITSFECKQNNGKSYTVDANNLSELKKMNNKDSITINTENNQSVVLSSEEAIFLQQSVPESVDQLESVSDYVATRNDTTMEEMQGVYKSHQGDFANLGKPIETTQNPINGSIITAAKILSPTDDVQSKSKNAPEVISGSFGSQPKEDSSFGSQSEEEKILNNQNDTEEDIRLKAEDLENFKEISLTKKDHKGAKQLSKKTGDMVFSSYFGKSDAVKGAYQLNKYTSMIAPLTVVTSASLESLFARRRYNGKDRVDKIATKLKLAKINTRVYQQRDSKGRLKWQDDKKKKPVFKKKLSKTDKKNIIKGVEKKLLADPRFKDVNLNKASIKDIKKIAKQLKQSADASNIALGDLLMEIARFKEEDKLKKYRSLNGRKIKTNLMRSFRTLLRDVDAARAAELIARYIRITKTGIMAPIWLFKKGRKALAKVVRPYGRHLVEKADIKLKKQKNKAKKKARKKQKRKLKRRATLDKGVKNLTGRTIRGHKRNLQNKAGRGYGKIKTSFSNTKAGRGWAKLKTSKVGKGFAKTGKGIAKVGKGVGKGLSSILGGTLGIVTKILNFVSMFKMIALIFIGIVFLVITIVCLLGAVIMQLFASITGGEVAVLDDGENKTLVQAGKDDLLKMDNDWYSKIKKEVESKSKGKLTVNIDPFTGKKGTSEKSQALYYFYNGAAYDAINLSDKEFSLNAMRAFDPTTTQMSGMKSNAKEILCAASVYKTECGIDDKNTKFYLDACKRLWNNSHVYKIVESNKLQYCPGQNCKSHIMDCRDKAKYNKATDFNKVNYNFTNQIHDCDRTYYCNDPASWEGLSFFGKNVTKKPSGKGCKENTIKELSGTIYCDWSVHKSESTVQGIKVPKGAKGSFEYKWKNKNDTTNTIDSCKHTTIYSNMDLDGEKIKNAITSGALQLTNKKRNGMELAYCSNLQSLAKTGTNIKAKDGYIMFDGKYLNKKGNKFIRTNSYSANGIYSYFYECSGHKITGYTFSYCPGHRGCTGHKVTYCLGHRSIEAHICIAGMTENEVSSKRIDGNLLYVDNLQYKKSPGKFNSKWKGYKSGDIGWITIMMEVNWEERYGIKEKSFNVLSSSSISASK